MKKALVFEARREGYGIDQIENPVTVEELRRFLEDFDGDELIILSHDNGYTYGTISRGCTLQEERDGEYGTEYEEIDEFRIW